MTWTYKGKEVTSHDDLLPDCTNFVYELVFDDNTKYIGKKCVRSIRRLKPTKAQLAIRKNYVRKELKNLPFLKYEGSSEENRNKVLVSKEILYQTSTKRAATYLEMHLLVINEVLFTDKYNNACIAGTHYPEVLEGLLDGNTQHYNSLR